MNRHIKRENILATRVNPHNGRGFVVLTRHNADSDGLRLALANDSQIHRATDTDLLDDRAKIRNIRDGCGIRGEDDIPRQDFSFRGVTLHRVGNNDLRFELNSEVRQCGGNRLLLRVGHLYRSGVDFFLLSGAGFKKKFHGQNGVIGAEPRGDDFEPRRVVIG